MLRPEILVEVERFELSSANLKEWGLHHLDDTSKTGARGSIRTNNPCFKRAELCQLELHAQTLVGVEEVESPLVANRATALPLSYTPISLRAFITHTATDPAV